MMASMSHNGAASQDRSLIIGMGATGLSVARYFQRQGVAFDLADTREQPPSQFELRKLYTDAELFLGAWDAQRFADYRQIVVSPGIALAHPVLRQLAEQGVELLGDVELFARAAQAPIIGITGSNGKSTVTAWAAEVLQVAGKNVLMGGNIGTPVLDLLEQAVPDVYVLELSSFQLETTNQLNALRSVVLNVSADHLDRYENLDDYAQAKARLLEQSQSVVVNRDDPRVMSMLWGHRFTVSSFGLSAHEQQWGIVEDDGEHYLAQGERRLLPVSSLKVHGRHNWANALAVLALLEPFALDEAAVLDGLCRFAGLPHRSQWVAERDGVVYVNDSKATNMGATQAALQGMQGQCVLLLGGQGKGQDFAELRDTLNAEVRAVVVMGEDAEIIAQAVESVVPVMRVNTLQQAVHQARRLAEVGDTVLLSPACASFDQYSGFAARGDDFVRCVQQELAS